MAENKTAPAAGAKPIYVTNLEQAYGPPSQAAFGGAVFFERLKRDADLDKQALATYRQFVGKLWDQYGEEAWLGPWKKVYSRKKGVRHDIANELRSIADFDAKMSVPLVLEVSENAEAAVEALAAAFDAPEVTDLRVYTVGDGGAMSGLLVAGRRENGEATFLVVLMD